MRRLFFFVNLLVIPLLSGWVVYRRLATPPTDVVAVPRRFDYFRLALQWPPSICRRGDPECPNDFTIHGLWPDNFTGPRPRNCTNQKYIRITGALLRQMQSNWPNIKNHTDVYQTFWRHEWRTHGTCSLLDQYPYFTLALNWKGRYNSLLCYFCSHGITPGPHSRYLTSLINSTVTNLTSKIPDLLCRNQTLREVHFCFYRNGVIINCPANRSDPFWFCSGNISFPQ